MLTPSILAAIMPRCAKPEAWALALDVAASRFFITSRQCMAAWLANVATESGELTRLEESLNYTPKALRAQWPLHFTEFEAETLGRTLDHKANLTAIAERAYGMRSDLGNTMPGDGALYIGRGAIQVTGKANYQRVADKFKLRLADVGAWLMSRDGAALSAAHYWNSRGLNALADGGQFDECCCRVTGAATVERVNGLGDRRAYHDRARALLRA
jgi:putative chitinase